MPTVRSVGQAGLVAGLLVLAIGIAAVGGSAALAGDWWLARQPLIGVGLDLLVVGLVATAVFALVVAAFEPIGWLRLLAVPPAILAGLIWGMILVFGLPTTGPGGPDFDVPTVLYSVPALLVVLLAATLLIASPLVVARVRRPSRS